MDRRTILYVLLSGVLFLQALPATAQFGSEHILATGTSETILPRDIYAVDLDGDGDNDVLSSSAGDDKIAWYENNRGAFGPQQIISEDADWAVSVYAADLDGDADPDVLSASSRDNKIAWYKNSDGTFGNQRIISSRAYQARDVYARDLDGDGLQDVLAALAGNDAIVWYKNLGGTFGSRRLITRPISKLQGVEQIEVADLDSDGDPDVLAASSGDDKIAWYPNRGGSFGAQKLVTSEASSPESVYAADLNGDSDADILNASWGDDTIAWYENRRGTFGPRRIISSNADGARSVYATDLDLDGDLDVLSASTNDNTVAWHQNLGGTFESRQIITTNARGARSIFARDLNGDGTPEVLFAASEANKIGWHENRLTSSTATSADTVSPDHILAPNYPNPFNPTTRIEYILGEPARVKLSIINAAGQYVALLVNDYQSRGRYAVRFDGTRLSSGIYFYRLRANDFVHTRQMIRVE